MHRVWKSIFMGCLVLLITKGGFAQRVYSLKVSFDTTFTSQTKIKYQNTFLSTDSRNVEIERILTKIQTKGHLFPQLDTIHYDSLALDVFINTGLQYKWVKVSFNAVPEIISSNLDFKPTDFSDKVVSVDQLEMLFEDILIFAEEHGYPFASVHFDSVQMWSHSVQANVCVELNKQYKIDTLQLLGKKSISKRYIMAYTGIKEGAVYNERLIREASSKIKQLTFIRETAPLKVYFTDKRSEVNLFLEKRNSNQFDGLIGFLPQNNNRKTQIIGQAHLRLLNSFNKGELIDINTKNLPSRTQDLRSRFTYPYLAGSPLGLDLAFELYKLDTAYIDISGEVGAQYLLVGGNYVKFFYRNKTTTLLSTKSLINATALPDFADVNLRLYGIGLKYDKLDYRFNPRKGIMIDGVVSVGEKKLRKNPSLNEHLYDGLRPSTTQYRIQVKIDHYLQVTANQVLNTGIQSASLFSEDIFLNELYRFGGISDLRGFDEESLWASSYLIGKLEYRYLFDRNSYFSLFYNQAWYTNDSRVKKVSDTPYGFGTGISFETKAGIFSLSYALGSQLNNPISLQTGKIHFGIINYF